MNVRHIGAAVLCASVLLPAAATARPMTIQDLLAAIRVSDPQLSPDGKLVLFSKTTTEPTTGKRNADIYVVAADGSSSARLLIGGDKTENSPRWSPDGKQIAFISTRAGAPQVFLAAADGSNVRQVTKLAGGAQPPLLFSPDGSTLAFVSDVYPDCRDEACNAQRLDADEKNPVKVHRLTRLLYRHWDEWHDTQRHHVFVIAAGGGDARDLTPGDFDSPPTQGEDAAVTFSPDGREVLFVSNREGNDREAFTTNTDVWSVPVTGGDAKKLTPNPAADVQPAVTKDGKFLIVRAQRRPGFESDRWYLDVYDRATGAKRTVFETPDLSVGDFELTPDGSAILFTATSNGADNLYRVPLAGGTPQQIAKGGSISAVQGAGDTIVFSRASLTSPPEIFSMKAAAAPQAITHENDAWLTAVTFEKPESYTVPGAGGMPIQYWIIKPPAFDPAKKYPVVFMIHGGPQGAWDDAWSARWNPSLWAAQGWVVAAPNPRGSFGFGQKFVDDISQDWGGKVMQDLDAVFAAVTALPYVDAAKQGVAGASYGGYAVDWLITHPNHFKVAVTHDGVYNIESMSSTTEELWFSDWESGGDPTSAQASENYAKWSPHRFAGNLKTTAPPTLVITNERDYRVPVDQGLQLFTALRRAGVPSQALVFPDEGHWVLKTLNSKVWHETVFAWIKKYLGD